jgi:hypothetical protein
MTIASGSPSLLSPLSLVVAIPALLAFEALPGSGPLRDAAKLVLASALLPTLFIIWSAPALRRGPRIPLRSTVLFVVLAALSGTWFVVLWDFGFRYQGRIHTVGVLVVSVVLLGLVGTVWLRARRAPSINLSVSFHTALFAWLAWGGFPWLGELP